MIITMMPSVFITRTTRNIDVVVCDTGIRILAIAITAAAAAAAFSV